MPRGLARFSLIFTMTLVCVVGFGLGAMGAASPRVAQSVFTLTLASLLVATLAAMVRQRRGAWAGFALFGWAYALFAFVPAIQEEIAPNLPITSPLVPLVNRIHPAAPRPVEPVPRSIPDSLRKGKRYKPSTKRDASGHEIYREFTPHDYAAWGAYEIREQGWKARDEDRSYSYAIGRLFLVLLFALSGAALGRGLADPGHPGRGAEVGRTEPIRAGAIGPPLERS